MKRFLLCCCFVAAACQPKFKAVEVSPDDLKQPPSPPPQTVRQPSDPSGPPGMPGMPPGMMGPSSNYVATDWRVLRGLNTRTGEIAPELKKLEGGPVRIRGYMVPFEDEYQTVSQFLLVPEAGMCVHVPPPPINQIILVEMTSGVATVNWGKPISVSGILEIMQSDSPYGKVAFKLDAALAEVSEG